MNSIRDTDFSPEFSFRTSRSSGPGGQNVNKVESRVSLLFDVNASRLLSGEQKALIHARLATRISKEGLLTIVAQKERSQVANKELVIKRFYDLLEVALAKPKKRVPTKISKAQRARIKKRKREQSERKAARRKDWRNEL
jgi:ribosome-associated protein